MGLDQYWFCEPTAEEKMEALVMGKAEPTEEMGYHRKWHSLNDFLGELYAQENPIEDFNCAMFVIEFEHLDELELALLDGRIAPRDQEEHADFHTLLKLIRSRLNEGRTVTYHPWW